MATKKSAKKSTKRTTAPNLSRLAVKDLNTVSKSFFRAAQAGSVKELFAVAAPDFRFIDEQGQMMAAAACSASLEETVSNPDPTRVLFDKEKLTVNSFNVRSVKTQEVGDTVIETMLYSDNVTILPRNKRRTVTFDRNFRWTNVWAKRGDTFKLVLTQLTPVTKQ